MLELATGSGLALAAGLNAWIPLLGLGLLSRYTDLVTLPVAWAWLETGWVLGILAVLLSLEVVADKIPVVDSVNDVVQTVVRPTAGGIAFGAGATARVVANTSTAGTAAPVVSAAEDAGSVALSATAVLLPLLVIPVLVLLVVAVLLVVLGVRRRRRRDDAT